MADSIIGVLKKKYTEEQNQIQLDMARGAKDWPEYQKMVGRFQALDLAVGELERLERSLMEGDYE